MLPILRIIPVGGVLLAIMILVLALSPPDRFHSQFPGPAPARGALIERADHPEWRQFLMLAATRRADELIRLRELPDGPVQADKPGPAVAGLPADRGAAAPDGATGAIPTPERSAVPVEIGEPSSAELPVTKQEETPPVITPALLKPGHQSRLHRKRRFVAAAKPQADASKAIADIAYPKAGTINQ